LLETASRRPRPRAGNPREVPDRAEREEGPLADGHERARRLRMEERMLPVGVAPSALLRVLGSVVKVWGLPCR